MKKILFLGASVYQIPPIKYAREKGYYVVACDKKADSPGFKFCHESYNISTTDKKKILSLSKKLKIDGIVTYASDVSCLPVSYVAKKLNLVGNPYEATKSLVNKDLFRIFQKKNRFNFPEFKAFKNKKKALKFLEKVGYPSFIKPVDSSGSKGVTKISSKKFFDKAVKYALSFSKRKIFIVEKGINRMGHQIAGDGFIMDGKLVFRCWADEHFDDKCNGLITVGPSFPTTHSKKNLEIAHKESQRLINILGLKTGAINFDFIFDKNNNLYFLDLGPRNGGGLVPELIKCSTKVDLIKYTVDTALGFKLKKLKMKPVRGFWSSYIIHSLRDGIFKKLFLSERIKSKIVEINLFAKSGDQVRKYMNSEHTLGNILLNFKNHKEMRALYKNPEKFIRVDLV